MKRTIAVIILITLLLGTVAPLFGISASAATYSPRLSLPDNARTTIREYMVNSSPGWGNYNPYSAFSVGNCTWYAFGRAWEILGYFPGDLVFSGDAEVWFNENKAKYDSGRGGFPYSTDRNAPALGAIAVWENTSDAYGVGGHVAVVEQISDNGDGTKTIVTSESAYSSYYFRTITRSTASAGLGWSGKWSFLGYIYIFEGDDSAPLMPPSSISSDSAAYTVGGSAVVSWSSVSYVDHYNIQINKDDEKLIWENVGTDTSYTIDNLEKGKYDFYVWSCRNGEVSSSRYCSFEVVEIAPPTSVSSDSSIYAVGSSAVLTWSSVWYADHYNLTVNKNDEFLLWDNVYNDTSYQLDNLEIGTYDVYVRTCLNGEVSSSRVCSFDVIEIAPPSNVTSDSAVYVLGSSAIISWSPVWYADHFNLIVNKNDEFLLWDNVYNDTSYQLDNLEIGTYDVYVRTCLNGEISSSRYCTFEVKSEVHQHSYTSVITAPTCTEQGFTTYTCTCGDSYKDNYTAALGHNYSYAVTTAPTVAAPGVLTGTCSRCNAQTSVALPKLSTTDYNYTITKAATCTATGTGRYTWKTTTYGTFYFDVTIPKTAHNYQTTVTPPTCTAQGYTTHTCSACGDTYKDNYTAALGHNYSYTVTTAPTVTAPGVLTGTCSRCNAQTSVALPKLSTTDYYYTITKAATCTATGTGRYTWKTTTYGTFYFDVTIPKTAHNYQTAVTPPTCTAQGYTTHTCAACGDSYKDSYTDALGHAWDNGVVTKPATETEPGIKLYTCTRCGATRTETIPVIGHVHNYTATVVAPTCTAQGYTLHTCSCGDSYKDSYTAALGHSFGAWTTVTSATCTASGTETRTCTRCGQQESRAIPALGHAESDWIIDRNPSCTASGYKHTECTRCGVTVNTAIIAAVGHKESGWITDKAATCTASGTRHTECTVCGATIQTGVIPALGHAWDDGIITKPATETETGVKTFTCTRCGATRTETIPKTGLVNPFVDVKEGKYYYNAVLWAFYHEPYQITKGTDDTHFSPNQTCNRAQVVSFLWNTMGKPEPDTSNNPFVDVKPGKYYYKAVLWAYQTGVTKGADDTHFNPSGKCNRAQVVSFLWNAMGKPEPDTSNNPFVDVKPGKYYYKAVLWAYQTGVTKGADDTHFNPSGKCNRAQVVTFLYNTLA